MNNTIKEIQKLSNTEGEQVLKALQKLYNELNYYIDSVSDDWKHKYLNLTDNNILWYMDEKREAAIRIETGELLTKKELAQLLNEWTDEEEGMQNEVE